MHRVGVLPPFSADDGIVARLDALPALVAVHAIKPALQRSDLPRAQLITVITKLVDIARAGRGADVAPVEEAVEVHALQPALLCQLQDGKDVRNVAVHAAV